MKTNNPKLLFLACMLAVLFACNSDSPKVTPRSTTSNTATNLPGTGLMTVNMVSPANGALNVRSDTNIILVFSEEVDFTTLTGAVTITGSLSGGHAFTGISGDSTVYSLNPTVNFTASEVVTVTLTSTTVDPIESTGGKDLYTALPSTTKAFPSP
jgi:hypothetical protein